MKNGSNLCDAKWNESVAVGDKQFVAEIKSKLGAKAMGRRAVETGEDYELREEQNPYKHDLAPKNSSQGLKNEHLWQISFEMKKKTIAVDKPMSPIGFKLMTWAFRVRDFIRPRMGLLAEAGIEPGFRVLDYGCGPGSYIPPLAQLVGASGEIYALDINPLAIKEVRKIAARKAIPNIKEIVSDCNTGLPDYHVDAVLLYDTFHDLSRPDDVLQELHRVLKSSGTLSFSDHHMKDQDILTRVTKKGLFKLSKKGKKTYCFAKSE